MSEQQYLSNEEEQEVLCLWAQKYVRERGYFWQPFTGDNRRKNIQIMMRWAKAHGYFYRSGRTRLCVYLLIWVNRLLEDRVLLEFPSSFEYRDFFWKSTDALTNLINCRPAMRLI